MKIYFLLLKTYSCWNFEIVENILEQRQNINSDNGENCVWLFVKLLAKKLQKEIQFLKEELSAYNTLVSPCVILVYIYELNLKSDVDNTKNTSLMDQKGFVIF